MFLKNYYVIPFIIELILALFILLKGEYLFIHGNVALGLGIGVLALAAHRLYKMLSKITDINALAFSRKLTVKLDDISADKKKVMLGRGFLWQNKHVQAMSDLSQVKEIETYCKSQESDGNPLIHGVGQRDEENIYINTGDLNLQSAIIGGTGSGKTRTLEFFAVQAIKRGEPVIIIDPKGDNELVDRLYDTCCSCNRENDWQFFSLVHPKHSVSYNPLSNFSKGSDIASRIKSIMDNSGDSFYNNFIWGLVLAVVDGLIVLKQSVTLKKIEKYALGDIKTLYAEVKALEKQDPSKEESSMINEALKNLEYYTKQPDEFFQKVRSNLMPVLRALTIGEVGSLLSETPSDITWENVVHKNKVVYMYLGSMLDATVAQNVGRMALQDFLYYAGTIYAFQGSGDRTPINLFVDEFYNVMFDGYVDLLNKSRGAGVRASLFMQTSKDIESVTQSAAKAAQILANTNIKIFGRIPEPEIAELCCSLYGKTTIQQKMSTDSATADVKGESVFTTSSGTRQMPKEVPLLNPEYITGLQTGHAFVYVKGRMPYKLRFPIIEDAVKRPFMENVTSDKARRVI